MTTVDEIATSHKKSRHCGTVFSASSNHPTPLRDEIFSAHRPAACAPRGLILPFAPPNQGASPAVKAQIALRPTQCFGNFPRHAGRHFAIVPRRVRAIDRFIMPPFRNVSAVTRHGKRALCAMVFRRAQRPFSALSVSALTAVRNRRSSRACAGNAAPAAPAAYRRGRD